MLKRVLVGSVAAGVLIGCGGGSGDNGSSYVMGVNAIPNVGAISITANGSQVLSDANFGTNSSQFVAINAGSGAQLYMETYPGSVQLSAGVTNFVANDYYAAYGLGSAPGGTVTSAYVFIYPTLVAQPPVNEGYLIFVNCSTQVAVDVYATLTGNTQSTTPTISALTPFNSGVTPTSGGTPVPMAVGTYTVNFNLAGTSTVLLSETVTIGTTPTTDEIQIVGLTDNLTSQTPAQYLLPIVPVPVVSSAGLPRNMGHPIIVGHPGMTSFPRKL